jgi:hypothetical protein
MKKLLFAMVATVAFTVVGAAGGAASFAVGSAKADLVAGSTRLALSAHNGALAIPVPADCSATGHLNYSSELGVRLSANVITLTILPGLAGGGSARIVGEVTKVTPGFGISVGDWAVFDVTDSNMHPDGFGDSFLFEGITSELICYPPIAGAPITKGNIVVKAGSLVP